MTQGDRFGKRSANAIRCDDRPETTWTDEGGWREEITGSRRGPLALMRRGLDEPPRIRAPALCGERPDV